MHRGCRSSGHTLCLPAHGPNGAFLFLILFCMHSRDRPSYSIPDRALRTLARSYTAISHASRFHRVPILACSQELIAKQDKDMY